MALPRVVFVVDHVNELTKMSGRLVCKIFADQDRSGGNFLVKKVPGTKSCSLWLLDPKSENNHQESWFWL